MSKDNYNDYEELLSMFEKDSAKKENQPAKATDEDALKSKRQKKVEDFKININSNSAYENPNYKGGVYFSNPPRDIDKVAQREKRATVRRNQKGKPAVEKFRVSAPPTTAKQNKAIAEKKARNQKFQNTFFGKFLNSEKLSRLALAIAIIALSSVVLCIYGIRCINDVLAIDVEDTAIEVEVSKGMSDADVIDVPTEKAAAKECKKAKKGESDSAKKSRSAAPGFTRLFLNFGKADGFYANHVIELINRNMKGSKPCVGKIDLLREFSFFEVAEEDADSVIKALNKSFANGRRVVVEVVSENTGKSDNSGKKDGRKGKKKEQDNTEEFAPKKKRKSGKKNDWQRFFDGEFSDPDNSTWAKKSKKRRR